VVEFESDDPKTAVIVEPNALRIFRDGLDVFRTLNYARADSIFLEAGARNRRARASSSRRSRGTAPRSRLIKEVRARGFVDRGGLQARGPTPGHFTMVARLAIVRNDRMRAITAVRECLLLDPTDRDGACSARRSASTCKPRPSLAKLRRRSRA
jgi:hypothetical protein